MKVIFTLILLFCFCFFTADADNSIIPDTPAGKKLSEMLSIIDTEDEARVLAFIRSFDPSFLEQFSEEEHRDVFRQLRERTGGLEIIEVANSEPHELSVIAKSKKSQKSLRVMIKTSTSDPFALTDIGIRPLDSAGGPKQQKTPFATLDVPATQKRLDELLSGLVPRGLNGAVLVAQNGQIIFHKGYGLANCEARIPINEDTAFDVASATKDFTHTAIFQLVASGKIKLQDPITKYFPNVPADKAGITIQQLLIHTAGFPAYSGPDDEVIAKEDFLKRIFSTTLLCEPGKKESYSNPGYSLLAAIIQNVSGLSFEQYLKANIFDPVGMAQTGYVLPKWKPGQIAHTYGEGKDRGSTLDFPHATDGPYWNLRGNGGTLSPLTDMFRFYEAAISGKLLPKDSELVIFRPDEELELAGSDGFHYFVYSRSPVDGITTIVATTDPAVKAPAVRSQIAKILKEQT